jgi:putative nucleotidyltransferase with HDIG domain
MRDGTRHVSVRPYLPHALIATVGVVGLPFLAVLGLIALFEPDPSPFLLVISVIAVTLLAAAIGMALWRKRPESADIAFGELLIWGWLQRKRAEDQLDHGARLLGLDRSGRPTEPPKISPEHQLEVLTDLNSALEAKDPYTHGHSQRVERHSYRTAAAMGLSVSAIEELRLAAALHDVGKIRVPDRILRKPERLTDDERNIVEDHVVVGAWMVSSVGSSDVITAVRHHHERWDGRGYPDGLAGADIPLYARIIAVADAYDAITSTRPYRVSSGREHAVSVLKSESGSQFDPMIVNAFVEALPLRLPVAGAVVLLAGPFALGRRLAMWLKRVGAGHLAPAAATLGAIVTLGAFMPAPSIFPPPDRVIAQEAVISEDAEEKPKVERRQKPDRDRKVAVVHRTAGEGDVVLGESVVRPAPEPAAEEPKEEPKPKPDPVKEPEPEPTKEPEPDPEPTPDDIDEDDDDSESCSGASPSGEGKGHDKGKGEGHSKHCD